MSFYEEFWRRERPLGRFTRLRGCVYLTNPPPLEQWERVEKVKMPAGSFRMHATDGSGRVLLTSDGKAPIAFIDGKTYRRGLFVRFDWEPEWRKW